MKEYGVQRILLVLVLFVTCAGWAQQNTTASVAAEDPADEIGKLKKNCFAHAIGCAEVLFTGQPLHIAAGSIAPQNGVGLGLAYVGHKTTENWRMSWNADGVASFNGSWRAGLYMKLVDSRIDDIGIERGTRGADENLNELPEQPVINLYAQTISLNKLTYFGLGNDTVRSGKSFYGMTETIVGASGVRSISTRGHVGIYGEVNGRIVDVRGNHDESAPSIEQGYTETTAPGLTSQPFFLQLGVGLRLRPSFGNDLFHLNYDVSYRPFFAVSDTRFSFQRFTLDLSHQLSLYRNHTRRFIPRDTNGPDDCVIDPADNNPRCPPVTTRNLEGSLGVRFFTAMSMTQGNGVVPFYFQPTIGGSDVNGNSMLPSYDDYRFRAPNLLMFRENFEHSIGKWPIGVALIADQGKVALATSDLGSNHWRHSFATGLTVRAGGFPQIYLLYAWGGERTHTIFNINNSLLGASQRPSLF